MADVVALGELLIDFSPLGVNSEHYPTLSARPGGAPANFLAAMAALGSKTALLAKVGDDNFGRKLVATLSDLGIENRGIIIDKNYFTTLAFVSLDESGERSFAFSRKPGADTQLRFDELDLSIVDGAKVFHFGSLSLTHEPARSTTYRALYYAKSKNMLISYDPNLRLPLWDSEAAAREQILWGLSKADIVKISDDEVRFLFNLSPADAAAYIRKYFGVKLVFVSCGAEGCFFSNAVCEGFVSAPKVKALDTTGAGDVFGGCALWKILQCGCVPENIPENILREITAFACHAASIYTSIAGGLSSISKLFPEHEIISDGIKPDDE